jgi:hypothetical protein
VNAPDVHYLLVLPGTNRQASDRLKYVEMKMLSKSTCNWKYYFNYKLTFDKDNRRKFYTTTLSFCAKARNGAVAGPCVVRFNFHILKRILN